VAHPARAGCHFFNCCNREVRTISKKKRCLSIERCKLAERNGNPMMISAIVVFQVVVPHKALMKVASFDTYMQTQALAVLRQVVAQFPFESHDGTPCLLHDSVTVSRALATQLNQLVAEMGVHVTSFSLDEISFAPEIASSMLQRQAAQALVHARQVIVHGASELAASAVAALAARGVKLTHAQRTRLIGNLLPVLCASEREGEK
jgi:regulator of protease activity HflC (stomatin/prohibitin superfamily)